MTVTTSYGTWNNRVDRLAVTLEQSVQDALGDFASDYDIRSLVSAYRAAINAALPDGVALAGSEFYGPYYRSDASWPLELEDDNGRLDIKAIVDGVDFWALAERYELTSA